MTTNKTSRRGSPVGTGPHNGIRNGNGNTASSGGKGASIPFIIFVAAGAALAVGALRVKDRMKSIETSQDPVALNAYLAELDAARKALDVNKPANGKKLNKRANKKTHPNTRVAGVEDQPENDPGYPLFIEALDLRKDGRYQLALDKLLLAENKTHMVEMINEISTERRKTQVFKRVMALFHGDVLAHAKEAFNESSTAVFVAFNYQNREAIGLVQGNYSDKRVHVNVIFADRPALKRKLILPLNHEQIPYRKVDSEYMRGIFHGTYESIADAVLPRASSSNDYYDLIILAHRLKLDDRVAELLDLAYDADEKYMEKIFMHEIISRGLDEAMMLHFKSEDQMVNDKLEELMELFPRDDRLLKIIRETDELLTDMRDQRDRGGYKSTIQIASISSPFIAAPPKEATPKLAVSEPVEVVADVDTDAENTVVSVVIPQPGDYKIFSDPDKGRAEEEPEPLIYSEVEDGAGRWDPNAPTSARGATEDQNEILAYDISRGSRYNRQDLVDNAEVHFKSALQEYKKWKDHSQDNATRNKILKTAEVDFDKAVDLYQQAAEEETNPEQAKVLISRATDANLLLYACKKHGTMNVRKLLSGEEDVKPKEKKKKKKFSLGGRSRK